MDALSLYRAGHLREAIDALGDELKKQPLDTKRRTFLFELLCFAGEYRPRREATRIYFPIPARRPRRAPCSIASALHAERERQDMFARNALPLGSAHPSSPGELNGGPFYRASPTPIPRIGANLEAFIAGSYTWIPFAYIESIETEPPKRLRDLLWMPGHFARHRGFPAPGPRRNSTAGDRAALMEASRRRGAPGPGHGVGRRPEARTNPPRPEAAAARRRGRAVPRAAEAHLPSRRGEGRKCHCVMIC